MLMKEKGPVDRIPFASTAEASYFGVMNLAGPAQLGFTYLISELLLSITRRSRGDGVRQDRSTLRVLWVVIMCSVGLGLLLAFNFPETRLSRPEVARSVGLILFLLGLGLRWWAIVVLGRFFTVDVQIAKDHEIVEAGPFRYLRHPSYTGVLLAFLGFGLSLANWLALLVVVVPIFLAFLRRMKVEEEALTTALGDKYREYIRRTNRLIPGLY